MTYTDFLALWTDPANDPELAALKAGGVKAIRTKTGLNQTDFAQVYGIPRGSIKHWETTSTTDSRTAPPYVTALLAYAVLEGDRQGKE